MSVAINPTIPMPSSPTYTALAERMSPKEVAQEFESLFLSQLLTIMQESVESEGLFEGGPGKEIYMGMMNQEMGRALAAGGGVGLSKLVEPYMSQKNGSVPQSSVDPAPSRTAREMGESRGLEGISDRNVSSKLGWRNDPFTGEPRYHKGVDFALPYGTQVRSLTSGRVLFSGRQGGYGNTVVVESENGMKTRYAHLSELGVNRGEEVSRGQEIGKVGDSGRATGPHLHLEMERAGKLLNPLEAGLRL
jgi:murein DD-endopeptidase MepM/ murein hydrolase activator NlpD